VLGLPGRRVTSLPLPATDGRRRSLDELETRTILFLFPGIGGPADPRHLEDWKALPGAYGCTSEACAFRDELLALHQYVACVLGLSSQDIPRLQKAAERLRLNYPLLSDESLVVADSLGLPTFEFHGARYFERLTLVIRDGRVEAALYPVVPPEQAAAQALEWLSEQTPRD
jgi:peroxiredoxin